MSSLRNAVKRHTHKERQHVSARRTDGSSSGRRGGQVAFVERRKDWQERARDRHKKQEYLSALRRKASARNPDEFSFGMVDSKVTQKGSVRRRNKKTAAAIVQDRQRQQGQGRRVWHAGSEATDELRGGPVRRNRAAGAAAEAAVVAADAEAGSRLGHDTVQLLKSQDVTYVANQKKIAERKVERLRAQLHGLDGQGPPPRSTSTAHADGRATAATAAAAAAAAAIAPPGASHIVFVDTEAEAEQFDPAEYLSVPTELLDRKYNRPRTEQLEEHARNVVAGKERAVSVSDMQRAAVRADRAYQELEAREKRAQKLAVALAFKEREKAVMGKGKKRKIKDSEGNRPAVYKWKRERSR